MRQLLITFIPALAVFATIVMVNVLFQISMPAMTRDVTALANIHPLSGILSNLGILLWSAAAAICAFAAVLLRNRERRDNYRFLFCSALLSAYLLFDDFFLIHEELASRYLGLGERKIYALLVLVVLVYLSAFRRVILRTNFGLLLLALGFFTTSVAADTILDRWLAQLGIWKYFVEDGSKWLGIASWCSYFVVTSQQFVVSAFSQPDNARKGRDN